MSNYYHDNRLSASKLKPYLAEDPAIAHWRESHSIESTDALRLGSALHLLMEGKEPVVSPFPKFQSNEAKAWKAENPEFLKAKELDEVEAWKTAILHYLGGHCPYLWEVYHKGEKEPEFYTDTHKAKIDCIHDGVILDWKSTAKTSAQDVLREYRWGNAALQAGHYVEMAQAKEFYFVVVSKVKPHPVWVIQVPKSSLEYGLRIRSKAEAIRKAYLDGVPNDVLTLDVEEF